MSVRRLPRRPAVALPPIGGTIAGARVAETGEAGDRVELERDGLRWPALVSVSCLVPPRAGDTVLVFHDGDEAYVIQVLRRGGDGPVTLALPGRGPLAIEGETLALIGRRRLALTGDRLDLHGRSLALVAETTTWLGRVLTGVVDHFRISAKTHETSAGTLVEKATDRTAIVEGTDSVRAETRVVTVTGIAAETARSKVVAVTDDLRMDGKRITMG